MHEQNKNNVESQISRAGFYLLPCYFMNSTPVFQPAWKLLEGNDRMVPTFLYLTAP